MVDNQEYADVFKEEGSNADEVRRTAGSGEEIKNKLKKAIDKVDFSAITKPECENLFKSTRHVCVGYIVFVLVATIALIGIFIWKFFRSAKDKFKGGNETGEQIAQAMLSKVFNA